MLSSLEQTFIKQNIEYKFNTERVSHQIRGILPRDTSNNHKYIVLQHLNLFSLFLCFLFIIAKFTKCVFFEGPGTKDQRLPGTDCFIELKMQDAGSEGQACHHAADSE